MAFVRTRLAGQPAAVDCKQRFDGMRPQSRLTKLILALAILVIPLAGMAETLVSLVCIPHMHTEMAASHHGSAAGDAHHHGPGLAAETGHDDNHAGNPESDASGSSVDGSCCISVVSALPPTEIALVVPKLHSLAISPDSAPYSTYLKLFLRPPLG